MFKGKHSFNSFLIIFFDTLKSPGILLTEPSLFLRRIVINNAEELAHKLHALVLYASRDGLAQKLQKVIHVEIVGRKEERLQLLVAHHPYELCVEVLSVLFGRGTGIMEDAVLATILDNPIKFAAVHVGKRNGGGGSGSVIVDESLHYLHFLSDIWLHLKNNAVCSL